MKNFIKYSVTFFVVLLACWGCMDFKDSLIHVEVLEDGSAMVTVVFSDLSEKLNGKILSRLELIESMRDECVRKGKESTSEQRLVVCEADSSPGVLGVSPPSDGRIDGYYTMHYKKATTFFEQMSTKKGGVPVPVEFEKTDSSFRLRTMSETVTEGLNSCTFMIQTPWPIKQANADVIIGGRNLAIWNCTDDKDGLAVELEAQKRIEPGAIKESK